MPSPSRKRPGVGLLALAAVLLVGCATHAPRPGPRLDARRAPPWEHAPGHGGSGWTTRQGEAEQRAREVEVARAQALVLAARGSEADEAVAREAEAARARAQVSSLAHGVEELGARLTFSWWAERGALTPLGYREERGSGRAGHPVDGEGLERMLRLVFSEYVGQRTGEVVLTLRREETRWAVDYAAPPSARPPEAKTLPVRARGIPVPTFLALQEAAKRWLRTVQVPHGGALQVEMRVHLEDGRLGGWELLESRRTREGSGGPPRALSPKTEATLTRVLLPFTEGLGSLSVHVVLQAEHTRGEARARGRVELARVERPPPSPELSWYRSMHEATLLRWREDVHAGSAWLAQRSVEELALWYAGSLLACGASFFALEGLTVVTRALGRGPEAAAGWLRTTLARLSGEKRKQFEQLWRKVRLEGEQSLSRGERRSLRGLMEEVEELVHKPLTPNQKEYLRSMAREYYQRLHPELAPIMDTAPRSYPVHHRRPLEHAHLFPEKDINSAEELILLRVQVHTRINTIWAKFRARSASATAHDVEQVVKIIDKHFEARWYNRVELPESELPLLDDAMNATLTELRQLFPGMN